MKEKDIVVWWDGFNEVARAGVVLVASEYAPLVGAADNRDFVLYSDPVVVGRVVNGKAEWRILASEHVCGTEAEGTLALVRRALGVPDDADEKTILEAIERRKAG